MVRSELLYQPRDVHFTVGIVRIVYRHGPSRVFFCGFDNPSGSEVPVMSGRAVNELVKLSLVRHKNPHDEHEGKQTYAL